MSREIGLMARQTRIERWLDRQLARTQNPRQAAVVIAVVTTSITVLAGLLMTVVDHGGFPTLGSGLWWAVQTVTTVGYGDNVPTTVGGQLLASVVMLLGIGFITVITAAITSSFISRARLERRLGDDAVSHAVQLKKIDERLERIEAAVGKR
jgi:voltage-gated potassium channel